MAYLISNYQRLDFPVSERFARSYLHVARGLARPSLLATPSAISAGIRRCRTTSLRRRFGWAPVGS